MAPPLPKPTKIPRWADTGTRVEPAEAKKDSGWVTPEVPPDTFFNWLQGISGDWLKWIDERMFDGGSPTTFKVQTPNADAIADQGAGTLNLETGESRGTGAGFISMKVAEPGAAGLGINAPVEYIFFSGTSQTIRIKKNTSIAEGLNVGFEGTVVADQIQVADTDFIIDGSNPLIPHIRFDTGDHFLYNRTTDQLRFAIASTELLAVVSSGVAVFGGLDVGFAGIPVADQLRVSDTAFIIDGSVAGIPQVRFDTDDLLLYNRAANQYRFQIGAATDVLIVTSTGTAIPDGLDVGFAGTPVADQIRVADANFILDGAAANPTIVFDDAAVTPDAFRFIRNATLSNRAFEFLFDNVPYVQITSTSVRPDIGQDLVLDLGSTPNNRWNDVWANSGIFIENLQTPTLNTDLVKRHAQNAVVARANVDGISGTVAILGDSFNATNPVRVSAGRYTIDLSVPVDTNSSIIVTCNQAYNLNNTYVAYAIFNSSTQIEVSTNIVNSTNIGVSTNLNFAFEITGRPATLPT